MTSSDNGGNGPRVALFLTCLNDALYGGTGRATVQVLERVGCTVEFPMAQTCCGQMHLNSGYRREAVSMVRHFVEVFEEFDAVVAPSGSCVAMVRDQHVKLARSTNDPGLLRRVEGLTERVFELTEYLIDVLGVDDVGAYFPHYVTYHPTCHSVRLLGVGDRPLRLLRNVRGLTMVDLPGASECCGFGGTFALKNAAVSTAMVLDKVRHVKGTGAEYVVTVDNSCLTHIGGALSRLQAGVAPIHLVQILAATEAVAGVPRAADHDPLIAAAPVAGTQRPGSSAAGPVGEGER